MLDPSFLRKHKSWWVNPLKSLFFHVFVIVCLGLIDRAARRGALQEAFEHKKKTILVRPLSEEEFRKNFPRNIIVDTIKKNDFKKESKDRAKYLGEKTQRVKEETRADGFGSSRALSREKLRMPKLKEKPLQNFGMKMEDKKFGSLLERGEKTKLQLGNFNLLDPDVKISTQTILNTDEYVYSTFYNRMREAIVVYWEPKVREVIEDRFSHLTPGIYKTETKIYISQKGEILDVEVEHSSGVLKLDDIASTSIREARAFLNPPKQLFERDPRAGLDFGFYVQIYPKKILRFGYEPDQRLKRSY